MVALQVPQLEPEEVPADGRVSRLHPVPPPGGGRRRRVTRAEAYRRRRLLALVVAGVGFVGLVAAVEAVPGTAPEGARSDAPVTLHEGVYVVQAGDNLWSIARRIDPDADPRPLVAELRSLHGEVDLQVGDRLEVGDLVG